MKKLSVQSKRVAEVKDIKERKEYRIGVLSKLFAEKGNK